MGRSQSKQVTQQTRKDGKIRFALIGNSGSGKSSFVNAIRGLPNYHGDAAAVTMEETTREPTEYHYPDKPNIIFVDPPGTNTQRYPDVPTYWRSLGLETYDIFLLFVSIRFTKNDLDLAKRVKSIGKSFFLIRTWIDTDCSAGKRRKRFKEEELLQQIKYELIGNLRGLISSEKDIFLIDNYHKDRWDFPRLIAAINGVLSVPEGKRSTHFLLNVIRDCSQRMAASLRGKTDTEKANEKEQTEEPEQTGQTTDLTKEYWADARAYIQKNGVAGIEEFLRKKLDKWNEATITFGITGDAGTGKSAFVNAIRGLNDDDYAAAKVGVTETTLEPKEYEYLDNKRIKLVDLPGIGTPKFPDLLTYCTKVGLEKYNTFLIFTKDRFTINDLQLAEKVKDIGRSFFLIRTKIDADLTPNKGKAPINEEQMLEKIRKNLTDNVKDLISSEKEIFLISNYDKDKWDFDRLVKAIGDALPVLQREVLLLSLSNLTRGCLKRKAMILKARAVAIAAVASDKGQGANPFRSPDFDVVLIKDTIMDYYRRLGLHDITSDNFERFNEFKGVLQRYHFQSGEELFLPLESELRVARESQGFSKYIPIVGTIIAGRISFRLTVRYLLRCVDELEEVALAVWDEAVKRSTLNS